MQKLRLGQILGGVVLRVINPLQLLRAARLHVESRRIRLRADDAQLALYAEMLPSDFLHFGYFDDPDRQALDISLTEFAKAQERYAELILERVVDRGAPVLDVGAGMGGLARMLIERGFQTVALTPDRAQAAHLQRALPQLMAVARTKLEDLACGAGHDHTYGTVITSESLQYLKLPRALPVIERVLRPRGRWIVCDFFHRLDPAAKGCHHWDTFLAQAESAGWRTVDVRDITANVLPNFRYIHTWATRAGLPLMKFAFEKNSRDCTIWSAMHSAIWSVWRRRTCQ